METEPKPDTPSSAWEATREDRELMRDMLAGLPAIAKKPTCYLTKWRDEDQTDYDRRVKDACFTPILEDIVFGLTSKPFTREVSLEGEVSASIESLTEDIDGEGNNLHVFAQAVFEAAVSDGFCGIMVDYPPADPAMTRADEQARQIRPYWVRVDAANLIAVYTVVTGGVEEITHARIRECTIERDGFGEKVVERIRVLEPGAWQLWREEKSTGGKPEWVMDEAGVMTLPYVPLVIFYAGRRVGTAARPPLTNLARMQVELFRKEANLKSVQNRTAFPMVAANGMMAPTDGAILSIGPGAVLFGGEGGAWAILEPAGSSLELLAKDIETHKDEMRRLGMQPLLPGTGTITATATGVEAAKAHSMVQRWALGLKDALEQAFAITSDWLKEPTTVEVHVHTDFGADIQNPDTIKAVLMLREAGDISREAELEEMKRLGVLRPDYDIEADGQVIEDEQPDLPDVTVAPMPAAGSPMPGQAAQQAAGAAA